MITILSPRGTHYATLEDAPDGIAVTVYGRAGSWAGALPYRRLHTDVIDASFHVVADRMVDMLEELEQADD